MRDYFIRRFLLIIPTMIGLTLLVFAITRFVPGGPMERAMMQFRMASSEGRSSGPGGGGASLSESQLQQLKAFYGFDKPWPLAYADWLGKVCQGDLGTSTRYTEPVWDLIAERLPVSTYFGLMTFLLSYGICIPLGVLKALKHQQPVDTWSSVFIFAGYAIPSFALGALLVVFCAARWQWFPVGGFTSDEFEDLSLLGQAWDILQHTALPLICYLVGSFAFLTMMKKNSLLDNLAADYIRTAVAKGCDFKQAVRRHALRNSFIPIATSLGHNLTLFIAGSFLIESIFDINGFGLLGYQSLLDRDYPVVMGQLVIVGVLTLLGNILSDFFVALTDPRVRFE
ncbi:MAG TPA: peptide ABC transporter permease [Verrucomicrobiales bacterium]|nr:peptide ABC transporter permease [Verrucomicrobiales bacterium]